jgi:isoleucyl-tRNA synthetase
MSGMAENQQKSEVAKREEGILAFWKERDIFAKSVEKHAPNGEFVFYDGPPFATGLPHHGSLLSSIIKDVVPRYKTMRGYRVRRRWGWDCHGLPIETLVEKELGLKTRKDIETIGVKAFNEKARSMVLQFVHDWEKYVERIGRWVDFKNSYKTMDNTYIESVWWALKQLWEKELLYEGRKVLMYCPHDETPLAKAEIAMDNTYKDITEEAVTVKFKVKDPEKLGYPEDSKIFILAWTTTPWTLPGNVGLAVGREIDYVMWTTAKENVGTESYIMAAKRFNAYGIESGAVPITASQLIGLEYEPLFDVPALNSPNSYKVWDADFVTTEEGTGVVHTAVMYGEDDFVLGEKEKLPMVQLLDAGANYNELAPEFLRGKYIKSAEKDIKHDLEARGLLFDRKNHTHSYPHCYRCGTPLIYNAVPSWFIGINRAPKGKRRTVKERMLEENENVNWIPEHLKHGRFGNIVESAPDWTISRNRFWASPLPIWKCQKCQKIEVLGSISELKEKAGGAPDDLHRPYIDGYSWKCECGGEMKRIPEVVDCWVESGSMPFAEYHYPFENKHEFEKRAPGDFIAEYIAQTRTWFYYMHAMGVLLFDRLAFKNVVTTGTVLAADGQKISKSKGNYTDPLHLIEQYGADAMRFNLMASPVMRAEDMRFRDEDVRDAHNRVVQMMWNCYNFFALYKSEYEETTKAMESTHPLDLWVLASLAKLEADVTKSFDSYDMPDGCRMIKEFIDDYSTWYVRRSRERTKSDGKDKQFTLATQQEVLNRLARVIAPIMPFVAESLYKSTGGGEESVHLERWPEHEKVGFVERIFRKQPDEPRILHAMKLVRSTVSRALEARDKTGIRVRQPLAKLEVAATDFETLPMQEELLAIIADEVNVKKVVSSAGINSGEVALDTTLTDELREEGLVRETIREIQAYRKENGLKPEESAVYKADFAPEQRAVVEKNLDSIQKTTRTVIEF